MQASRPGTAPPQVPPSTPAATSPHLRVPSGLACLLAHAMPCHATHPRGASLPRHPSPPGQATWNPNSSAVRLTGLRAPFQWRLRPPTAPPSSALPVAVLHTPCMPWHWLPWLTGVAPARAPGTAQPGSGRTTHCTAPRRISIECACTPELHRFQGNRPHGLTDGIGPPSASSHHAPNSTPRPAGCESRYQRYRLYLHCCTCPGCPGSIHPSCLLSPGLTSVTPSNVHLHPSQRPSRCTALQKPLLPHPPSFPSPSQPVQLCVHPSPCTANQDGKNLEG